MEYLKQNGIPDDYFGATEETYPDPEQFSEINERVQELMSQKIPKHSTNVMLS
jgi:hypothetical protein